MINARFMAEQESKPQRMRIEDRLKELNDNFNKKDEEKNWKDDQLQSLVEGANFEFDEDDDGMQFDDPNKKSI